MSDDETLKESMWSLLARLVKSPALAFIVLGIVLYVIAAIGSWERQGLRIDLPWRIVVVVLGTLLLGAGAMLLWRPPGTDDAGPRPDQVDRYGVDIVYPSRAVPVRLQEDQEGRRYFPVRGRVKVLPKDAEIWVFVAGGDGQRWPHGPAIVDRGEWEIDQLLPGAGRQKKIEAYVVGRNGRALVSFPTW